jgi:solute carrier family 9B (sodium/hydrogen exchanger), member 1/2
MSAILTVVAALVAAWILGRLARAAGLPAVVGMLAGGLLIGAGFGPWLEGTALPGAALSVEPVARPIRLATLALVLLRAGVGLSPGDLRSGGPLAMRLGLLPMMGDALAVTVAAHLLLSLSWPVALVLGFTVAAISPAIVIPGLLGLLERCRDGRRRVLTALLAGAPVDNLAAVVLLGLCLDLALGEGGGAARVAGGLALDVIGGLALGLVGGRVAAWALATPTRLAAPAAWAMACLLVWAGERVGVSFVLAVLAAGMVIAARTPRVRAALDAGLTRL